MQYYIIYNLFVFSQINLYHSMISFKNTIFSWTESISWAQNFRGLWMRLVKNILSSFIHVDFRYQLVNFRELIFFNWIICSLFTFQIYNINLIEYLKRPSFVAGNWRQKRIHLFLNILRFFFNLFSAPYIKINRTPSYSIESC